MWANLREYLSICNLIVTEFSPFAAVSLSGVAGLAETFPFFSVGGPFLLDFPGFQVPSDSIFPSQLWSSSRALPLHLHFCNCSDVFSFTSPFYVSKPFQPSPSHNRRYRFHLCFFQDFLISSFLRVASQSSVYIYTTDQSPYQCQHLAARFDSAMNKWSLLH